MSSTKSHDTLIKALIDAAEDYSDEAATIQHLVKCIVECFLNGLKSMDLFPFLRSVLVGAGASLGEAGLLTSRTITSSDMILEKLLFKGKLSEFMNLVSPDDPNLASFYDAHALLRTPTRFESLQVWIKVAEARVSQLPSFFKTVPPSTNPFDPAPSVSPQGPESQNPFTLETAAPSSTKPNGWHSMERSLTSSSHASSDGGPDSVSHTSDPALIGRPRGKSTSRRSPDDSNFSTNSSHTISDRSDENDQFVSEKKHQDHAHYHRVFHPSSTQVMNDNSHFEVIDAIFSALEFARNADLDPQALLRRRSLNQSRSSLTSSLSASQQSLAPTTPRRLGANPNTLQPHSRLNTTMSTPLSEPSALTSPHPLATPQGSTIPSSSTPLTTPSTPFSPTNPFSPPSTPLVTTNPFLPPSVSINDSPLSTKTSGSNSNSTSASLVVTPSSHRRTFSLPHNPDGSLSGDELSGDKPAHFQLASVEGRGSSLGHSMARSSSYDSLNDDSHTDLQDMDDAELLEAFFDLPEDIDPLSSAVLARRMLRSLPPGVCVPVLRALLADPTTPKCLLLESGLNNSLDMSASDDAIRGTTEWAPPRKQIIFTIQPRMSRKLTMKKQNFLCAGCGTAVEEGYIKLFRFCEYFGKYFCASCHNLSEAYIPARVLHYWDFKRYYVSNLARKFLDDLYSTPVFVVVDINPGLFKKSKSLARVQLLREQLAIFRRYFSVCHSPHNLLEKIDDVVPQDINAYSMDDFVSMHFFKVWISARDQLIAQCDAHVKACVYCSQQGFYCEFCQGKDIIYPYELAVVYCCPVCKHCFHKICFNKKKVCPSCVRRQEFEKKREKERLREKELEKKLLEDG